MIKDGIVYARFNRLQKTGDIYDSDVSPSKNFLLSYALGGGFSFLNIFINWLWLKSGNGLHYHNGGYSTILVDLQNNFG